MGPAMAMTAMLLLQVCVLLRDLDELLEERRDVDVQRVQVAMQHGDAPASEPIDEAVLIHAFAQVLFVIMHALTPTLPQSLTRRWLQCLQPHNLDHTPGHLVPPLLVVCAVHRYNTPSSELPMKLSL